MERSLKIKAHIEKADLLRKNMELFPLVDKEVGDSLLKTLSFEMKKLRDGEVVQGFDATLVSRVQNVQDTYKRLQQYLLDQKKAVEEQQAGLLTRQAEVPDTNEEHLQQEEVSLSAQDDFADVGSDGSEYQGGENSENSESSELSDSRQSRNKSHNKKSE